MKKIKIIKCKNKNFWYKNYIGKEFEVEDDIFIVEKTKNYKIKNSTNLVGLLIAYIDVKDCKIV